VEARNKSYVKNFTIKHRNLELHYENLNKTPDVKGPNSIFNHSEHVNQGKEESDSHHPFPLFEGKQQRSY
jgi:hypothetical protein